MYVKHKKNKKIIMENRQKRVTTQFTWAPRKVIVLRTICIQRQICSLSNEQRVSESE